jgi:hypothetical protein
MRHDRVESLVVKLVMTLVVRDEVDIVGPDRSTSTLAQIS